MTLSERKSEDNRHFAKLEYPENLAMAAISCAKKHHADWQGAEDYRPDKKDMGILLARFDSGLLRADEKELLLSRYRDHRTLHEIGEKDNGCSRERVRQKEQKALLRLATGARNYADASVNFNDTWEYMNKKQKTKRAKKKKEYIQYANDIYPLKEQEMAEKPKAELLELVRVLKDSGEDELSSRLERVTNQLTYWQHIGPKN